MTRRSTPQQKIDDAAFPVRVIVQVPDEGFGRTLNEIHAWLVKHVGRGSFAHHAGGRRGTSEGIVDTVAFYFRDVRSAAEFVDHFGLRLADGTTSVTYTAPGKSEAQR